MAGLYDVVSASVAEKVSSVNTVITTALQESTDMFAILQDLGNLQPPYTIFNPGQYSPESVVVAAEKPDSPDTTSLENEMSKLPDIESFSEHAINEKTDDQLIPQLSQIMQYMPAIPGETSTEQAYTSELLSALQEKLVTDLQDGVTGLTEEVETAMWERRTERENQAFEDAMLKLRSQFASTGWTLPGGNLSGAMLDLSTKQVDAQLDLARDITTESFKMAIENQRFSVQQGIVLESALMQHFNNVYDRAMKYLFARAELGMKLFTTVLDGYKSIAEMRLSDIKTQVEAERGRVDIYLGKINAIKAKGELIGQRLDVLMRKYGVNIQAYVAELGMSEANAKITVEQQRIIAQQFLQTMTLGLEASRNNLTAFTQISGLKKEAAQAMGTVLANYISSALNAINTVIQESASASLNQSETV